MGMMNRNIFLVVLVLDIVLLTLMCAQVEAQPPENKNRLHHLLGVKRILIKEQEEQYEQGGDDIIDTKTDKKSSVSWLLAAAIRMCKDYPIQCLRQRRFHENFIKRLYGRTRKSDPPSEMRLYNQH